jgi:hypothetical protein
MSTTRPPSGSMVWWRQKGKLNWLFGYCTYVSSHDLIRLGRWNGDTIGGYVVSISDIEWRPYR